MSNKNINYLKLLADITSPFNKTQLEKILLNLSLEEKKELIKAAEREQIIGFLYNKLKALDLLHCLPFSSEIKDTLKLTSFYNLFYLNYMKDLSSWAEKENIKIIFLKGISILNYLYPSIDIRPMADLDILFRKEDFLKIEGKLESDGFSIASGKLSKEFIEKYSDSIEFWKRSGDFAYSVDCHFHIIPTLSLKAATNINIESLFERSQIVKFEGIKVNILSWEDFIIFGSVHIWLRHPEKMKLKQFLDLALIIPLNPPLEKGEYKGDLETGANAPLFQKNVKIDFDKLISLSEEMGIELPLFFTIKYLEKFYNLELSEEREKKLNEIKGRNRFSILILNYLIFPSPSSSPLRVEEKVRSKIIPFLLIKKKLKFLKIYFIPPMDFLRLRYPEYKNWGILLYFVRVFSFLGMTKE